MSQFDFRTIFGDFGVARIYQFNKDVTTETSFHEYAVLRMLKETCGLQAASVPSVTATLPPFQLMLPRSQLIRTLRYQLLALSCRSRNSEFSLLSSLAERE